jgi:hypothetical protein
MGTNRYTRRSINLDDASHNRCKELADDLAISVSGLLRIIIKEAYEEQIIARKQDASQSCLQSSE